MAVWGVCTLGCRDVSGSQSHVPWCTYLWLQPRLRWWSVTRAQTHLVLTTQPKAARVFQCRRSQEAEETVLSPLPPGNLQWMGNRASESMLQPSVLQEENFRGFLSDSHVGAVESSPRTPKHPPHYICFSFFPTLSLLLLRIILEINYLYPASSALRRWTKIDYDKQWCIRCP